MIGRRTSVHQLVQTATCAAVLFPCLLVVAFCKNGSFKEENGQRGESIAKTQKVDSPGTRIKKSNVGGVTEETADRGCVDSAATRETTHVWPEELREGQFMDVNEVVIKRARISQRK